MHPLLQLIIIVVVAGVLLAILRFAIAEFFPEMMRFYRLIVLCTIAGVFIYALILVFPLFSGPPAPTYRP